MTVLPVVDRELRVASRRAWTYWGRAGAALATILVSAWFLLLQSAVNLGQMGKPLFGTLSFLAFVFAAFAGVTHSADSVSAEKREGTLGLLFLTDLHGFDVTLGKLTASSLGALYSLLASLPVLALAWLLGGVTAGEYWRMVLALLNTLLLSLAAGMLSSVLNTDGKRAALATFVRMLAAFVGVPFLVVVLVKVAEGFGYPSSVLGEQLWPWLDWLSPGGGYFWSFDDEYKTRGLQFWLTQGYTFGLAVWWLLRASRRLPHSWQETGDARPVRGWRSRIERWRFPTAAGRNAFRMRLLELNPVVWLTGRHWLRPALVWLFLLGSALLFLFLGWLHGNTDWFNAGTYFATSILLHLGLKIWIASEAPRQFLDDRRSGAMELLLSTPLTVPEMLQGRLLALRRQFAGPIIAVLGCDALVLGCSDNIGGSGSEDKLAWSGLWALRIAFLVFDGYALAWVGLGLGMSARSGRATMQGLLRILGLPWLACFGFLTAMGLLSVTSRGNWFTPSLLLGIWFVIGAGNNLFWLRRVRGRLAGEFRELALHRPDQKRGWFRRKSPAVEV